MSEGADLLADIALTEAEMPPNLPDGTIDFAAHGARLHDKRMAAGRQQLAGLDDDAKIAYLCAVGPAVVAQDLADEQKPAVRDWVLRLRAENAEQQAAERREAERQANEAAAEYDQRRRKAASGSDSGKRSPLDHAVRLGDEHGEKLMVVRTRVSQPLTYVLGPNGIWQRPPGLEGPKRHHDDAAVMAADACNLTTPAQIGNALSMLDVAAALNPDLGITRADFDDLDHPDSGVLGVGNGVWDLATGRLLTGEQAAAKRITVGLDSDLVADADQTDGYRTLAAQLEKMEGADNTGYILTAMAASLWGDNRRHFNVIAGPPKSGKTTRMEAFAGLLGGYAVNGEVTGIASNQATKDAFSEADTFFAPVRMANFSELDGVVLDRAVIKRATDHSGRKREMYKPADPNARRTAMLWLWCNDDQVTSLGFHDQAIRDRGVVIYTRRIDDDHIDPALPLRLNEPAYRQGLLAHLARLAPSMPPGAPLEPHFTPTIIANLTTQADRDRSEAGGLLASAIHIRGRSVLTNKMMRELLEAHGIDRLSPEKVSRIATANVEGLQGLERERSGSRGWIGAVIDPAAWPEGHIKHGAPLVEQAALDEGYDDGSTVESQPF